MASSTRSSGSIVSESLADLKESKQAVGAELLSELRLPEQKMFWDAIWDLANHPESLREYGIKAIYGNAVYKRLRPGLIYVFKIGNDGQVYPETVLDM